MELKANLKIVLHANDVVVAESEDPKLWQQVLAAMSAGGGVTPPNPKDTGGGVLPAPGATGMDVPGDSVDAMAAELSVDRNVLIGACEPITESPYIQLDKHFWEAFKRNTPPRGPGSINATVLAATLLVLWKDCAKLGDTKLREVAGVIGTLALESKNPTRSVNNCEWLQLRNGNVKLNAAQTSKAIAVARAYCLKKSVDEE